MDRTHPSSSLSTAIRSQKNCNMAGYKRCSSQNQNSVNAKKPSLSSPLSPLARRHTFEDGSPTYHDELITFGSLKKSKKQSKGKQKIAIEFVKNRTRRYSTFCKRKTGLMKKAVELAELTGAEVLLLIASETNHVYTYATPNLRGIIDWDCGKELIHSCLSQRAAPTDRPDNLADGDEEVENTAASSCESQGQSADEDKSDAPEEESPPKSPVPVNETVDTISSVCLNHREEEKQQNLPTPPSVSDGSLSATNFQPISGSMQENLQLVLNTLVSNLFFSIADSSGQGRIVALAPEPTASTVNDTSAQTSTGTAQRLCPVEIANQSTVNPTHFAQIKLCAPNPGASNLTNNSQIVLVPQIQLAQIIQPSPVGLVSTPPPSSLSSAVSLAPVSDSRTDPVYRIVSGQSANGDDRCAIKEFRQT